VWKEITTDPEVLESVTGLKLEFETEPPQQSFLPMTIKFSDQEREFVDKQIDLLLGKGAIEQSTHEVGEFVNNIFLRPKKDGSWRMILNLKPLNKFVKYTKFKMDTLRTVLPLIKPGSYLASIDLQDAYYTVKMHEDHQKYLKFIWNNTLYKFVVLPFGYAQAPRRFTKLMKPIYSTLRQSGHTLTGYIDDILVIGDDAQECETSVAATRDRLEKCGFVINQKKSVFVAAQEVTFLGFVINTDTMMITLSDEKKAHYVQMCRKMYNSNRCTIRELSQLIGTLVSSFSGVQYGPLFFRNLENRKIYALRQTNGDYDSLMTITSDMRGELQWWIDNLPEAYNLMQRSTPEVTVETDSTKLAWGCRVGSHRAGSFFLPEERDKCNGNINAFELLAIKLALAAFENTIEGMHVLIKSDNTTAVAYIKHMGGSRSAICNEIAHEIWMWAIHKKVWLSIEHLPGDLNFYADFESRNPNERTEWSLNPEVFQQISNIFGDPDIDLFAARSNFKVERFCSWRPEPGAFYVNAFALQWHKFYFYCFPPFSLIARCLQKIQREEAEGIILVPLWTTQGWFSVLLKMLIADPIMLPRRRDLLTLPHKPQQVHPMHPKLQILACKLSGKDYKIKEYHKGLPTSSCSHGAMEPRNSTNPMSNAGTRFVVKGVVITCNQL